MWRIIRVITVTRYQRTLVPGPRTGILIDRHSSTAQARETKLGEKETIATKTKKHEPSGRVAEGTGATESWRAICSQSTMLRRGSQNLVHRSSSVHMGVDWEASLRLGMRTPRASHQMHDARCRMPSYPMTRLQLTLQRSYANASVPPEPNFHMITSRENRTSRRTEKESTVASPGKLGSMEIRWREAEDARSTSSQQPRE